MKRATQYRATAERIELLSDGWHL